MESEVIVKFLKTTYLFVFFGAGDEPKASCMLKHTQQPQLHLQPPKAITDLA